MFPLRIHLPEKKTKKLPYTHHNHISPGIPGIIENKTVATAACVSNDITEPVNDDQNGESATKSSKTKKKSATTSKIVNSNKS